MKATQLEIIKGSVPLLQAQGEALTRRFYENMFENNPEVRAFFNPAHQQAGTQQRALANAICAYAQHIETPEMLADAIELIAQKHVSLGIKAEHYPIVGANLLLTLREVLAEAATDEVIEAWAAAYQVLADVMIDREQQIYQQQQQTYGWQGFKAFTVHDKQYESANICSFYLQPADGQPLIPQQPGQYITIKLTLDDGSTVMRNYSLSNAPGSDYYRISVKRELAADDRSADGLVSNFLHDRVQPGDTVLLAPPSGEFTLKMPQDKRKPLVFIAGGVGITPLLAMLQHALQTEQSRPVWLIQAARNTAVLPFSAEIQALSARYPQLQWHVRLSQPEPEAEQGQRYHSTGYIDQQLLADLLAEQAAAFYLCGPEAMLRDVHQAIGHRQYADDEVHYEFFGPAQSLTD